MALNRENFDPTKVNLSCSKCGSMSKWCATCHKFKCKRCGTLSTYDLKGRQAMISKNQKGCGCK